MKTGFKVDGLKEVVTSLRRIDKGLPKALAKIHKKLGEPVARRAKAIAPKRSGKLAADIRTTGTQKAAGISVGRKSIPYAGPIHFGWPARNIAPQTFMTDAIDDMESEVMDDYVKELEAFIDEVWITHI